MGASSNEQCGLEHSATAAARLRRLAVLLDIYATDDAAEKGQAMTKGERGTKANQSRDVDPNMIFQACDGAEGAGEPLVQTNDLRQWQHDLSVDGPTRRLCGRAADEIARLNRLLYLAAPPKPAPDAVQEALLSALKQCPKCLWWSNDPQHDQTCQFATLAAPVLSPDGAIYLIEHDGFEGTVQGHYITREGKRGVVLQQIGTRVCHVYGKKWLGELRQNK